MRFGPAVSEALRLVHFDPQTSGGLLLAVPLHAADELAARYDEAGQNYWRIGTVLPGAGIDVV